MQSIKGDSVFNRYNNINNDNMKKIFEICSDIRPLTVAFTSFMAGIFFIEENYWLSGVIMFVVIINLFYLKSK